MEPATDPPVNSGDTEIDIAVPPSGRGPAMVAVLGLLLAVGGIPWAIGFGPFGHRLLTGDEIAVHVLNLSGGELRIELSFAADAMVEGGRMDTLTTLSGGATLRSVDSDGIVRDEIEFDADGPVFYFAGDDQCFAVLDISDFYGGEEDEGDLQVVRRMPVGTNFHAFDADTIVLPRRVAPDQARGTVHWLEDVPCDLLTPENEGYLTTRSFVRLQQRRERYEEELREAREAAQGQ